MSSNLHRIPVFRSRLYWPDFNRNFKGYPLLNHSAAYIMFPYLDDLSCIVIDGDNITDLDFSAAESFKHAATALKRHDVHLKICGIKVSLSITDKLIYSFMTKTIAGCKA